MKKYLTNIERALLKKAGIKAGKWLGGGASCDVYDIDRYKGQKGLCVKYIYDARKKDVEAEYERYRRLYQTEPSRFAKIVDLIWISVPDEDGADPNKLITCAVMVMEKLSKVNKSQLKMWMIIKMLFDCTICLSFMHIIGIMHRDVKIQNVMYCERTGTYILLDYGISAFGRNTFTEGSCKGTPNNIAPGPLKGDYSCRDDLFSLGRMIREIFVGIEIDYPSEKELNGKSIFDYWYDQIEALEPLDENGYDNPELIRIINKLTEFKRENRYQNYQELLNDLKTLINSQGINVGRLSNIPHEFFVVMVNEDSPKGISLDYVRKTFHDYLIRKQITNIAVSVVPFTDTVYSRALNNGDVASAEIVLPDKNSDFLRVLLDRAEKASSGFNEPDEANIHVCAIGTIKLQQGARKSLVGLKNIICSAKKNPVAYRVTLASDNAFDVSDIGVSEIVLANSEVSLKRCLENWFNGNEEAVA